MLLFPPNSREIRERACSATASMQRLLCRSRQRVAITGQLSGGLGALLLPLPPDQRGVDAASLDQLLVGPPLDDLPAVEDQDRIRVPDRAEPVGDHDPGAREGVEV